MEFVRSHQPQKEVERFPDVQAESEQGQRKIHADELRVKKVVAKDAKSRLFRRQVVIFFGHGRWTVHGMRNKMRKDFFVTGRGPAACTS